MTPRLVKPFSFVKKYRSALVLMRPDSIDYIAPDSMTLDQIFEFHWEAQMSAYAETLLFAKYPYSKVVETLTKPAWKPLELHLGEDLCSEFMYMHGLRLASNIIVHTYKHRDNRMYVNLSDDDRSWEYGGEQGYKELLRTNP